MKVGDFVCTKNSSRNNKYKIMSAEHGGFDLYDKESGVKLWLPERDLVLWDSRDKKNDR